MDRCCRHGSPSGTSPIWTGSGRAHRVLGSSAVGRITADNPREGFVGDPVRRPVLPPGDRGRGRAGRPAVPGGDVRPDRGRLPRTDTLDEAIELANLPGYGLSSSIYTTDPTEAFRFRAGIGAGMVSVNNSTSGAEAHLPFGGNGRSGNGSRQSGRWVLDQFTRWQAMNWDYSGRLQKAQMDTAVITPDLDFRLP